MLLQRVHAGVAWFFVAAIVIQVFLAGAAIPQLGGSGGFATHRDVGYSIGIVALAVLLTGILARAGRTAISASIGLLILYVVQTVLPAFKADFPSAAALHPVNALVLFALAVWYARRAWRASMQTPA